MRHASNRPVGLTLALASAIGCGGLLHRDTDRAPRSAAAATVTKRDPATRPRPAPARTVAEARQRVAKARREAAAMTPERFATRYAPATDVSTLSYMPLRARHLAKIRDHFRIKGDQKEALENDGFVVLQDQQTTYGRLYDAAFHAHLPVVVTSDSILYAFHRSYDEILIELEIDLAIPELAALLTGIHTELRNRATELRPELRPAAQDLDVFLTVARRLLTGNKTAPVLEAGKERVEALIAAVEAQRPTTVKVIGHAMKLDLSMFEPRGHYTKSEELRRYFRAMSWIQRIPFRVLRQAQASTLELDRRSADAVVLLCALLDDPTLASWTTLDDLLVGMVGEQDNAELPAVRRAIGSWAQDLAGYAALPDAKLQDRFSSVLANTERISSELAHGGHAKTAPSPGNFYVLGQRFVLDSDVLSQVVYDRLTTGDGRPVKRMEPSVLDAQFVLGSNTAGQLLKPEIQRWEHQGRLHELRAAFDAMPADAWQTSIYQGWLGAIRSLNFNESPQRLPEPLRTRAWRHKTLNTQLASWAELRRDNILYAKQSFSAVPLCGFPEVYVEPEPQFFAAMADLHDTGARMVGAGKHHDRAKMKAFFERGAQIMRRLASIANDELYGRARSDDDMLFLQRLIDSKWETMSGGCTMRRTLAQWDGWYTELYYHSRDAFEFEPVIADVHTTPADAHGNPLGAVLHEGTDFPHAMVLTIPDDRGKSCAYVGPVSRSHTVRTVDFQRLNDDEWRTRLFTGDLPPMPNWQQEFIHSP